MPGDAGPNLLQSIANIGSRGQGQRVPSVLRFPQHARLQTVDDPGPPQRRPHNISGRLKRKAVAAEADKTRPHRDFRLALARREFALGFRPRRSPAAPAKMQGVQKTPMRLQELGLAKINGLRLLDFAHANQLIFVQARLSSGWGIRLVLGESPCAAPLCTSASVR